MSLSVNKTGENKVETSNETRVEIRVTQPEAERTREAQNNHPTAFAEKQTFNNSDFLKAALNTQFDENGNSESSNEIQAGLVRDSAASPHTPEKAAEVAKLQDKLIELGHLTAEEVGEYKGWFGPKTEGAVKEFQAANNLPVTGQVDQATADALNNAKPVEQPPTTPTGAAVTTVDQANKHHIVQFANETYNPNGPSGSSDCGPASLEMALQAAGIKTDVDPSQNNARLVESRQDMGKYDPNLSQQKQPYTSTPDVTRGANAAIDRARANGTLGANEGSATLVSNGTWESFDTALASGQTVVLAGDITPAYREANGFINSGPNKNYGLGDTGHFVAVLGRADNGNYIVSDPMSMNGAVEMTREQLASFTANPTDYVAIGGKTNAAPQAPVETTPPVGNVPRGAGLNAQQITDIINNRAPAGSPLRGETAEKLANHIVSESERTGVPAWLTLSQMRFENGFGNPEDGLIRERAVFDANGNQVRTDSAHNLFGFTGDNKETGEYVKVGASGRHFRAYNSWEESVTDYVNSISKNYKGLTLDQFVEKYFPVSDNSVERQQQYINTIKSYAAEAGVTVKNDTVLIK